MITGRPRLNDFQFLMREFTKLAPYNFIHALRLPGPSDLSRWQNAVTESLRPLGIESVPDPIDQPADLETHLEAELHRPFSSKPVRFFVVNTNDGGHWFGITLDHWFADDFSCRRLLQQIHSIYLGNASDTPVPVHSPVVQRPRAWSVWGDWRSFIKQSVRLRRACRVSLHDPFDFKVGTFQVKLPPETLDPARKLAKANGGTLHDLFLAATAQTFGSLCKGQSERDLIAITSVMNARRFEPETRSDTFGLNLSQYIVTVRLPVAKSLGGLAGEIAQQTLPNKTSPGPDLMAPTRFMWRLNFTRRSKATFFNRGAPMVAGLSNVDLTGSWIEQSEIADYRRVGPTGPIVPMVLMITTFRGRILFDVTFRKTAFSRAEAERLVNDIVNRLPKS